MWRAILGFLLGVGRRILTEIWSFLKSIALKEAVSLKEKALELIVYAEGLKYPDGLPYSWKDKFAYVVGELIEYGAEKGVEHVKTSAIIALQLAYEELRAALEKMRSGK